MKKQQLKSLIKHIMVEAQESNVPETFIGEMIANKNVEPDVFGAVNVEEIQNSEKSNMLRTADGKVWFTFDKQKDPTLKQYRYKVEKNGKNLGTKIVYCFNDQDAEYLINTYWNKQPSTGYKYTLDVRTGGGIEETESPEDVERGEHYLKGKFVERGEVKLEGGIDHKSAEKIANHHWDIFGSMGKDENGVYNFKTRGDRFCCSVGMLDGKPAMLSVTTTPGRLQLLSGEELGDIKENEQGGEEEEYEFKNGDKVRFTLPYGGGKNGEVFTLSQWDGRRGRVSDVNGRGWNVRRGQIMPVKSDDEIDEQSASGAAGAFSTPMAFKKRKVRESSFINKVRIKLENVEEKTTPDGRYIDDMLDGGRMKRAEGMPEGVDEVSGTRYFAEIPVGSTFKIPGQHVTLKKIGNEHANVVSTDKKKMKIKISNDERVNVVHGSAEELDEVSSSGAVFSGGPQIATPAWGTKNKLGSPGAIKATQKMGYKVVKSITTEQK